MARLNLQMFATTSIVDYLKGQGKDSSFSARKQLATQHGIKNYTGSAQQNTQLLGILSGGTTSKNTTKNTTKTTTKGTTSKNTTKNTTPKLSGVDESLIKTMTSEFKPSSAYTQAMATVQGILDKINSGKTSYTDQAKGLLDSITNREKFSYDVESDTMFQQYLSSMMQSGQTAMQDTMGQASALTGGYGSSYAQSVGNQAYNQYVQGAYDNLPEYYQMALQQYQMEGEDLYNQYALVSQADAQEYDRLVNSWDMNNTNAQQLYAQDYQRYADKVTKATNLAGMQNSDYWQNEGLTWEKQQFVAQNDINGDGVVNSKDHTLNYQRSTSGGSGGSKGSSGSGSGSKKPTQTQMNKILSILNDEGEDAMYKYIDELGDVDESYVYERIQNYGRGFVNGRTFTLISAGDSKRYAGKFNGGVFKDQYGNEYTLAEIEAIDKTVANKLKGLKQGQKVAID